MEQLEFTRAELRAMETIEQAWDGDELKIEEDGLKVWLTIPENRAHNGDYTIERLVDGKWVQTSCYFQF